MLYMESMRKPAVESVWDYPRPPRVEADTRRIVVKVRSTVIADSVSAVRVLETSHPPAFYVPTEDIEMSLLEMGSRSTFCEFKGSASYYDLLAPERIREVGWTYLNPTSGYEAIQGMVCFYPSKVECYVADERVTPQMSGFYGGWITSEIVGPFKGQ